MDESSPPPNDESSKENDNALLQFISDMLMEEEEDLSNNPSMLHDCLALQATEKSLYEALHNINLDSESRNEKMTADYIDMVSESSSGVTKNYRSREDGDLSEHHRSSKQLANNNNADVDDSEPPDMYDEVLLCDKGDSTEQTFAWGQSSGEPNRGRGSKKKNIIAKKTVDLRSLLMQCAQAVEVFDNKTLNDLLWEIRQHTSPKGDYVQRAAHYLANALDARLTCTGTQVYAALDSNRISTVEILKAYKMFYTACPFRQISNTLANTTIGNLATGATTLHIIDFGILYGFQWPCLIRGLSRRPGGPPKLRITGIDFPQPGFRPAERVVDTCRRLEKCAERFGVPFEYNAIAQKWDTVTLEDLKIEKKGSSSRLVVNCLHRLHNVQDGTELGNSPRDAVLNLIKKINPHLFVHGVANGSYNSSFFTTRFREALFHFCTMFDMFEATIPQEDDENRLLYEKQFFGKEAMNIIACDGAERVERPETYKHWQTRTVRAGFRQVSFDQEILESVSQAKTGYHKDFTMYKDGKWVLLGWKGRLVQGFSCWRPTHNRSSS